MAESLQKYFGKETSDNQVFDVFINSKLTDSLSEEMFLEDEKIVVSDTVKNMWKIPISEAGKPPLGLTLPVLSNTSALSVDKISEAVLKNCPEEVAKRKVLSENDVTQDDRGLRELIQVVISFYIWQIFVSTFHNFRLVVFVQLLL